MTTERRCPRCGRPLPPEAYYARLPTAPDREPAYVVRHAVHDDQGRKVGTCVGYAGAATATHEDAARQSQAA